MNQEKEQEAKVLKAYDDFIKNLTKIENSSLPSEGLNCLNKAKEVLNNLYLAGHARGYGEGYNHGFEAGVQDWDNKKLNI